MSDTSDIRLARAGDLYELVALWERSVRATHRFLAEEDIVQLRPQVRDALRNDELDLWVLADADDDGVVEHVVIRGIAFGLNFRLTLLSIMSGSEVMSYREVSEVRDGMQIDWDVPIAMEDGVVLRADVYRPVKRGKYPVIMSYGPYGKWLHFEDGYETAWRRMVENHPDVPNGSTNKYQNWEVVDPEKWVPDGYACVRVDSRGCGRSPGYVELWSAREAKDFAQCIEWGGKQPWSNGKVGLNGISYYAMNQWQVASLNPKHLAAICIWEGAADFYRDVSHHGGILCTFLQNWYDMQVKTVQHGVGTRGYRSRMNGDWVAGPPTLTAEELGANRFDFGALAR